MPLVTTVLFGDVALLPIQAVAPSQEPLAWLTEVFNSYNGTETRNQLRTAPRRGIRYRFPLLGFQAAYNALRGALRDLWAVPLWFDSQNVGAVTGGATTINCNTTLYDLRVDSLALLYEAPDSWQVVEISAVGGSSITITAADAFTDANLVPLRVGYIQGAPSISSRGHEATAELTFVFDDNAAVATTLPTQFLSEDLCFNEALFTSGNDYEFRLDSREDVADYALGLVARTAPWLYPRHLSSVRMLAETRQEIANLREWLQRRAGKYRAFWYPSFEPNLRPKGSGTVTTTFQWWRDDYDDFASDRLHVAFEDASGQWYARTLSGVTVANATTMQGTLNTSLGVAVADIRRVSYLGLYRLSSDALELNWLGNGVCDVTLGLTELEP